MTGGTSDPEVGPQVGRARERWLPMPSSASALGFAVAATAVFLLVEIGLAIVLWQTDPRDYVGLAYAAVMAAALMANFVVGVLAARRVETSRRREAELAAELARLVLSAGDLHSAADQAGRQLARALKLPFASLELREVPGDEGRWAIPLRNGTTVHGTLLVPADLPKPTRQRLQERVVPSLAHFLAAAHDRAATRDELQSSRDRSRALAEQQAALRRVATLVARGASPSEVFSAVAEEMARCLHVENASVLRYESDTAAVVLAVAALEPRFNRTQVVPEIVGTRLTLEGNNTAMMVLRTGRPARMESFENATGSLVESVRRMGLCSGVSVPIVVGGRVWGTAGAGSARPMPPGTEARMADFADLVATAIANAATRDELIASRARIVAAADDARRRLERDLHDGAQQRLVSLGLALRAAEDAVPPAESSLKAQLSRITSGLTGASEDLREIAHGLHPAILSKGGLGPALKTLARRSSVPVTLDITIKRRLPAPIEVAAYYVLAEALTNAAKHARASQVTVRAETTDTDLHLCIDDDGTGGADPSRGYGLVGLKDRVEALGGRLEITSPPGSGTSLRITLPLENE